MLQETSLSVNDLILPVFIKDNITKSERIESMPNTYRYSPDTVLSLVEELIKLRVPAIALFPVVSKSLKSNCADEAFNPDNSICRAIKKIKQYFGNQIGIISDIALDPYTDSAHDGVLSEDRSVNNDKSVEIMCKQALVHVAAGVDIVAPSCMMDGITHSLKVALDDTQFYNIPIMAYSAKFHSSLYQPFRNAIESSSNLGNVDKSGYQINVPNRKEALQSIEKDITEGASIIIVKPATQYLDILYQASERFNVPIIGYQVSGEYKMLCSENLEKVLESIMCIKRAGAHAVISYATLEIARYLAR
ncbi:MAG: delta-aminolevulinic acid dehydratase [Candidatus Xenolissoclinum pacificiensis L6]|uniref:Delta-aminolevulinic acid dehydratase n=1 Tax=Candidatus Xenolissoclinum pacificiensis L6 TaxID=1401685 RepID=W2V2N9_9RICK|nr:MAG: delta-aminolevulinic acid dehydratase [Candidatus Xenolissoclinum pacificiensis L6]